MDQPKCYVGVLPSGKVCMVGIVDAESVMECINGGAAVLPCTLDQARGLYGEHLDMPNLSAALSNATASAA